MIWVIIDDKNNNKKKSRNVSKQDLIKRISELTGLLMKDIDVCLLGFQEAIKEFIVDDKKVKIVNFGSFDHKMSNNRKGYDPRTQEEIIIEEKKLPKFNFSRKFVEQIANSYKEKK